MSLERVLKALMGLGLLEKEAEVFVYLARKGPKKKEDLCNAFDLTEQQFNQVLNSLQRRRMVTITTKQCAWFSASGFKEAFERLIVENIEQAQTAQKIKEELLESWQNMIKQAKI